MASFLFKNIFSFTAFYVSCEFTIFISFYAYYFCYLSSLRYWIIIVPFALASLWSPFAIFSFSCFSIFPILFRFKTNPVKIGQQEEFHNTLYSYYQNSQNQHEYDMKIIIINYLCIETYFEKLIKPEDPYYYQFAEWLHYTDQSELQHISINEFQERLIYVRKQETLKEIHKMKFIYWPSAIWLLFKVKLFQIIIRIVMVIITLCLDLFYLELQSIFLSQHQRYGKALVTMSTIGIVLFIIWFSWLLFEVYGSKWNSFCFNMIASKHKQFNLLISSQEFIKRCNQILAQQDEQIMYRNSVKFTPPLQKIKRAKQKAVSMVLATISFIFFLSIQISIAALLWNTKACLQEIIVLFTYQLVVIIVALFLFMFRIYIYKRKILDWYHYISIITGFWFACFMSESCGFIWMYYRYSLNECDDVLTMSILYIIGSIWSLFSDYISGAVAALPMYIVSKCVEACCSVKSSPDLSELSPENRIAHKSIEKELKLANKTDAKVKKLLLLGIENSGKSALFDQIKQIHGYGFENIDFLEAQHVIRKNTVLCMLKLLQQSKILYKDEIISEGVNFEDKQILESIQCVSESRQYISEIFDKIRMERLGYSLDMLWNLDAIQMTYHQRRRFPIPDNMDYYFNKVESIFMEDYYPSTDDILKVTMKRSGMRELQFKFEMYDDQFHVMEISWQRDTLYKLTHLFEHVTAIIFVADLNHYCSVCFEDEETNAMLRSLYLFEQIVTSKWFRQSEAILFLNNDNLFKECIRDGISLSVCFSADNGWDTRSNRVPWDQHHSYKEYTPLNDPEIDNALLEECYKVAVEFIKDAYLDLHNTRFSHTNKRLFIHTINTTNRDTVEKVFRDVQIIVIRSNLRKGGLV
eukprot:410675_1